MIKISSNSGLNLIPFIDIMLVLLAIILSIATFVSSGAIKLELPKAVTSEELSGEEKVTILINSDNKFYLDEKSVEINGIEERLNFINKSVLVELKSDKEAKFESFVQVIDILRAKNHNNFQIITQK